MSFAETLTTDSVDFCGEKSLAFRLNGLQTNLINYTADGRISFSAPANAMENGILKATVVATMKDYPQITSLPISF
jgi:hypothetical protein